MPSKNDEAEVLMFAGGVYVGWTQGEHTFALYMHRWSLEPSEIINVVYIVCALE